MNLIILGLIGVHLLAFMNGANDVSKTIASLVGSGLTNPRRAIIFGAAFNTLGGLAALFIAYKLANTFTSGIVQADITLLFAISVIGGAIAWLFIATLFKLPVSTTHSITGSLAILGFIIFGADGVVWPSFVKKVIIPLALTPLIAFVVAIVVGGVLMMIRGGHRVMDKLHWVSAAAASFARGLQDTPKIVALSTIFMMTIGVNLDKPFSTLYWSYLCVALAMGLGCLLWGMGVTKRLAYDITPMRHKDAFAANAVTSTLVILGAVLGLSMSTTHVSTLAITGTGAVRDVKSVQWKTLLGIIGSWIITLPLSGLCAAAIYYLGAAIF